MFVASKDHFHLLNLSGTVKKRGSEALTVKQGVDEILEIDTIKDNSKDIVPNEKNLECNKK